MRVMLLGAGGMLGRDLSRAAPPEVTLTPLSRIELDIRDTPTLGRAVRELKPELIINAAAYTAVDRAESEPEAAMEVNGAAVARLGALAAARGIRVVHFSTDYVFDGSAAEPLREDAPTRPINTYGATKLAGELALRDSGADALIIRTQWLFGAGGRSFPGAMWERATRGEPTRVVDDQIGRPTYTTDLADAAWRLVERRAAGLFHVANAGQATWYDVAVEAFQAAGRRELLERCTSGDFPAPARRPRYSVLATGKAETVLGRALPGWRDALARYLAYLVHCSTLARGESTGRP